MIPLKPITAARVPAALERARHYRLLNEPAQAESICLDILEVDPDHREALVTLVLARTDQFREGVGPDAVRGLVERLGDAYDRAYYEGIVHERWGRAILARGYPSAHHDAYHELRAAMASYERAAQIAGADAVDPVLRWNTCARLLNANPRLAPRAEETGEHGIE